MLHVTFSCIVPFPYSCSSFLFQDYQQIVNTTFLKAEIQKITIPLWTWSLRAPSFSIGSLDGLAFSQINVWPRDIWNLFRKFELATPISSYSSSLHLETTYYPLICSWIFFFSKYWKNPAKLPKRILQEQWAIHSVPQKEHYFDISQSKQPLS